MTAPTVSVVMAAYNGAALVTETLESLRAQTFTDFEVIVVDDRSTDDTRAVLRAFDDPRLRVIEAERNQGPVHSRNRAFAEARGRYIAALDQDDLCHPERFARQVAHLEAHCEVVLLGTAATPFSTSGIHASILPPVTTPPLVEWLLRIFNPLVWSSVMLRADAARTLDPFTRPDILYAEDFDLYHRMAKLGTVARLDEPLLRYRCHAGGASQRFTDTMIASATRVLEECHRPILGDAAADSATLIVRHIMGGLPVPNRITLDALGRAIVALQDDFIATRQPDAESRKLIRWETARRWARIGRAGLRAGTLALADTVAVRPDHLGLGYAGLDELVVGRMIGGARAVRRRYTG